MELGERDTVRCTVVSKLTVSEAECIFLDPHSFSFYGQYLLVQADFSTQWSDLRHSMSIFKVAQISGIFLYK